MTTTAGERVLIVEDEPATRLGLTELVRTWGFVTEGAADGQDALERITQFRPSIIISDLVMPRMNGLDLLRTLANDGGEYTVVILTAQGTVETAVEAIKEGAYDYLTKPIEPQRLKILLDKIVERLDTLREVKVLRKQLREQGAFGQMVGSSGQMRKVYQTIEQAAPTSASVLIWGESGTGKELVAQTIHQLSSRNQLPFVPINCAAIPETLLETELFGHEKGAFTGASQRKPGKFELAHRGTLFLDEIGDLPLALQAKILRALEEKTFERVGGTAPLHVDVRVVAATNRNLKAAVAARQYREDLYFRLSVFPIVIPPLRDRPGDIPTLARYFIDKFCRDLNKRPLVLAPAAEDELCAYPWPGNVRELQNCIERAAILTEGETIHPRHLNLSSRGPTLATPVDEDGGPWSKIDLSGTLAEASKRTLLEVERRKIQQAMTESGGSPGGAAEILQVSYKTLTAKLKEHGLE